MIAEPFSITLGVFGTIGFLNLARQGYEAVHKDIKAYRKAADASQGILEDADRVKWRIQLWKRIWSIDKDTHEHFPEYLWEDGWKHIRSQIGKIEKIARDVEEIILPFLREFVALHAADHPSASNNSKSLEAAEVQRLAQRELAIKRMDSDLWWGKKVSFVLSKSAALKEHLEKFPLLFIELDHICQEAYFDKHEQGKSITNQERRDTATMQMLVSQAIRTREVSWALHQCCHTIEDCEMELELSLLRWKLGMGTPRPFSAGIPERLCYYLVIPSATVASVVHDPSDSLKDVCEVRSPLPPSLEVLVEKRPGLMGECKQKFKDVLTELCHARSCYIRSTLENHGQDASSVTFRFSNSSDPVEGSDRVNSRLPMLLTKPATQASAGDLSFRERIEVAYRVAECCFLLLGTSWLSNLDSSNVTRAHATGKEARYRLLVGPRIGESDGYQDLQTRRVGQFLRELALGSNIGEYDPSIDLSLVSVEFGPQYQRAIDFCYKPIAPNEMSTLKTREEFEMFYQAILTGFFEEVVFP